MSKQSNTKNINMYYLSKKIWYCLVDKSVVKLKLYLISEAKIADGVKKQKYDSKQ